MRNIDTSSRHHPLHRATSTLTAANFIHITRQRHKYNNRIQQPYHAANGCQATSLNH
jgi:hypothetical protein